MHYVKYGFDEQSEYRPCFDVYSWRYLQFKPDGTLTMILSTSKPQKILKAIEHKRVQGSKAVWRIWNDRIVIIEASAGYEHEHARYEGRLVRQS